MYDIETLLVEAEALGRFGLDADSLMLPTTAVSQGDIAALAASHPLVLTF